MDLLEAPTPSGPIAFRIDGEGADLLLIHGGPGLSDYMDILTDEVAGWRTVRYQQRGLAPSTLNGPFTVGRHVADALAVLDTAGVDRAVVLGHSWGGHLALQLALTAPERVRAVIAIDALGSVGDGGTGALRGELRRRLALGEADRCCALDDRLEELEAGDEDALASLELLWPSYFARPASAPPAPPGLRLSLTGNRETADAALAEIGDGGFAQRLQTLSVPAIIVAGARSPMPVDVAETTAELLPVGELMVVPEAGHLPWHERPGCIAAALQRASDLG